MNYMGKSPTRKGRTRSAGPASHIIKKIKIVRGVPPAEEVKLHNVEMKIGRAVQTTVVRERRPPGVCAGCLQIKLRSVNVVPPLPPRGSCGLFLMRLRRLVQQG
ncbi:hypothetical protein EVAR_76595_1 [Eumeta japonica]|uniref:Uncharacterized protein n=1 Tax=Eumeta variegata TaxID=151549 RepID=A0A4C1T527_EUMVA|nr:hypothetical protein EVAR_76595_1 [Eumeta japonica]